MRSTILALSLLVLTTACSKEPAAKGSEASAANSSANDPGYVAEDPKLTAQVGRAAPAIAFRTIDGQQIDLQNSYGKRPVYLKLWATYCIPCRVQMPKFEKIYQAYRDKIEIIGVDVGFGEDAAKVRAFAQQHGLHMPMAMDDGSLAAWLGMDGTPVHLLIDRDGRVAFAGHQNGPALDAALKAVTEGGSKDKLASASALPKVEVAKSGQALPALDVIDAQGKTTALRVGGGDRPTAILLTSTWCETYLKDLEPQRAAMCKAGRQAVQRLAKEPGVKWQVIVSHLWTKPEDLVAFQKELGLPLPIAMDHNGDVFRALGVQQFPAVALIDKAGRLQKVVPADGGLDDAVKSAL